MPVGVVFPARGVDGEGLRGGVAMTSVGKEIILLAVSAFAGLAMIAKSFVAGTNAPIIYLTYERLSPFIFNNLRVLGTIS